MSITPKIRMNTQLLADNETEETVEEKLVKLQEQLVQMNGILEKNKQLEQINNQLFTKNQEYFLKITSQNNIDEEDINETNEYEEYVGTDFYKTLSTKEKKLLETILEGED